MPTTKNKKRKHCYVCSDDYWPKRCTGADSNCYTIDQCCREILDVSYEIEEWQWFYNVCCYAMLEK